VSATAQLKDFLSAYTPEIASLARGLLVRMRRRLPGAVEMVYDNYNGLVIGFGPSERVSEAVFSLALYPRWVNLFFLQGAAIADPGGLLQGAGSKVRHMRIEAVAQLDDPRVGELLERALSHAGWRPSRGPRRLIVQSISAKRRPRLPA
jgi:hypothetical protein